MTLQVEFQPQALGANAGNTYRVPTPGPQGEPGYSPTVTVETITGGHRITITDADGDHVFDVMDGEAGPEGYSPVVTITAITGGHRVTITDAEHPDGQSFDVMDGAGGGGGAVDSVNGQTGDVVLDADDVGAYELPSGGIPKSDLASDVQTSLEKADTALQSAPVTSVNGQTGDVTVSVPAASSATPQDLGTAAAGSSGDYSRADHVHNKPTYSKSDVGLGNVDNVQQYSATNPPPYPVTSVNGNTGAVSLSIPATAADVGAVAVAQGVAHAGEFVVVGSDGNITTVTMTAWSGGSY